MEIDVKNLTPSLKGKYLLLEVEWHGKVSAGQFFRLKTTVGPYIPRPFSVYDYNGKTLKFLVKGGGEFERYLRFSSSVEIDGPLGNSIPDLSHPLLIAGGVGYAPLHFYAKERECEVILGMKDDDLLSIIDLPSSVVCTFEPSTVLDVAVYSPLENVIACGPLKMLERVKEEFANRNLFLVLEERMACGRGMCEGCAVRVNGEVKFVCKDGPTFKAEEVDLNWRAWR